MAPATAGIPHGTDGTVDPRPGGPDQRPGTANRPPDEATRDERDETPVRTPVSRDEGQGVRSGSASAAAKVAGSEGPVGPDEETDESRSETGGHAGEGVAEPSKDELGENGERESEAA